MKCPACRRPKLQSLEWKTMDYLCAWLHNTNTKAIGIRLEKNRELPQQLSWGCNGLNCSCPLHADLLNTLSQFIELWTFMSGGLLGKNGSLSRWAFWDSAYSQFGPISPQARGEHRTQVTVSRTERHHYHPSILPHKGAKFLWNCKPQQTLCLLCCFHKVIMINYKNNEYRGRCKFSVG